MTCLTRFCQYLMPASIEGRTRRRALRSSRLARRLTVVINHNKPNQAHERSVTTASQSPGVSVPVAQRRALCLTKRKSLAYCTLSLACCNQLRIRTESMPKSICCALKVLVFHYKDIGDRTIIQIDQDDFRCGPLSYADDNKIRFL